MIGWLVYTLMNLDPLALLGGAVFVFAAGMPIVGFMLGSQCSPCCGAEPTVCSECTAGKLPNTIKVTLSNMLGGCLTTQEFVLRRGWTYVAPGSSQTIYNKNIGWYEFNECTFGFVGRCPQDLGYIGSRDIIEVRYRGPDLPPVALFNPSRALPSDTPGYPAQAEWTAPSPIENCSAFAWTATNGLGQTITVEPDGAWEDKADSGLPDTLTATFDGFKDYRLGGILCPLTFTAPFGSGAAGHVSEPWGYAPEALGPIEAVVLSNAGSGYARYGRVEPEISVEPPAIGTGADLSATLAEQTGGDGLPLWKINTIDVDAAGSGYVHWGLVQITPAAGVKVDQPAEAHIVTVRSEPSLTATAMSGNSDAVLSVSMEEITDAELDYYNGMYRIAAISVTQPGTGYDDGSPVLIAVDTDDDIMAIEAVAHIVTKRIEPTLSIAGNAVVDITLTKATDPPARWSIASIAVTDGGSGYTDGETVAVVGAPGDESECSGTPNTVIVHTVRDEPTIEIGVTSDAGSGAELSATLNTVGNLWFLAGVVINEGGADYAVGDQLVVTVSSGQEVGPASGEVASVDTDGAITSVTIIAGGAYFLDTGVVETVEQPYAYPCQWWHDTHTIQSVVVDNSGAYYRDTGEIESVKILDHGIYYAEDADADPYVAEITVAIEQDLPSAGTGGEISAVVNADTSSPNFGSIASLSIDEPGDGYLAGEWIPTCQGKIWNGRSIVLTRGIPGETLPFRPNEPWVDCAHSRNWCERCFLDGNYSPPIWNGKHSMRVYWNGSTTTPAVEFGQYRPWTSVSLSTAGQIEDCSSGSFVAIGDGGQTITFESGGEYEPDTASTADGSCHQCCDGEVPPEEIEVTISFGGFGEGETLVLQKVAACRIWYQGEFLLTRTLPGAAIPQAGLIRVSVESRLLEEGECENERCDFRCVLTGLVNNSFDATQNSPAVMCGSADTAPSHCSPSGAINGGDPWRPYTINIQ